MVQKGFSKTITFFIILCCCGMIGACGNGQQQDMEKYIESTKARLMKIEHEILALRERADNMLTPDTTEFEAQIEKLSELETTARQQLEAMQNMESAYWIPEKAKMDSLMQAVEKAYQNTRDW